LKPNQKLKLRSKFMSKLKSKFNLTFQKHSATVQLELKSKSKLKSSKLISVKISIQVKIKVQVKVGFHVRFTVHPVQSFYHSQFGRVPMIRAQFFASQVRRYLSPINRPSSLSFRQDSPIYRVTRYTLYIKTSPCDSVS
jgi:hypothetical protein